MSPYGVGWEPEVGGSGSVIFCVYDTVVLDSSEYTTVWSESPLECIVRWRGVRLAKSSVPDGVCVLFVTNGSKMSPCV